jgi:tRNA(Ile)-lysidine synthase
MAGVAFGMADHVAAVTRVRDAVGDAVGDALQGAEPLVLAVSGGCDSMVLLDVFARHFRDRVACVATFDHGSGASATAAAELVKRRARALGIPVRSGRAQSGGGARREAEWREARWSFLRDVSRAAGAAVATAHTRDDQVETVFMRVLRGSAARGLAGLYARSAVVRPLLSVPRRDVACYAAARGVQWIEDPSNSSRRHLRNRVRLDLLPALERSATSLSEELLELSRRAALLRDEVDDQIANSLRFKVANGTLEVARADLQGYDAAGLRLLWPALAARAEAVLDRRGTERITEFTIRGRAGARIQLSGGWEVVLHRGSVVLRRARSDHEAGGVLSLEGEVSFGCWHFRPLKVGPESATRGRWSAALPVDATLTVRPWLAGDRMTPFGATAPRRIKGLFRDAGIDAVRRRGWPVVLADDEIVWIPGVRRGAASEYLSDRRAVVYECERYDD